MEDTLKNKDRKTAEKPSKHICIGLLAHVDAGKTTLAESILYQTGSIRKLGRVDHKDAFLDTGDIERARGITIFSKQAELTFGETEVTLLDTPGHVDFSAEMERALQVLDYAVLVINGADGVQSHTRTLWKLLTCYKIPAFLFVNKMDQEGTDRNRLLDDLKMKLDDAIVDFCQQDHEMFLDQLAMCGEEMMEEYLERGDISVASIADAVADRKVFPCYFGSALKVEGVEELLSGIDCYTKCTEYPEEFGARIYKITRDRQGSRLTHMKITGGSLKVKGYLTGGTEGEDNYWKEKADQIRIYSGTQFVAAGEVRAGTICAVTGLTRTYSGEGLGMEAASSMPVLEPVLTYQILLPEKGGELFASAGREGDIHGLLTKLRLLEEEEPHLHITWNETLGEIHAQVMGEIEIEILKNTIADRFGIEVEFGSGNLVYKETIAKPVEGVGHFEPLRHYAEVHLLLEPLEAGSGLQFDTCCSEDVLAGNWQRLILTHLEEKKQVGVLTGSEITDMKITLTTGRAHNKHTEGGDFRQATYRAVRQGLKKAQSILLEPVYEFRLEVPAEMVGRALSDVQKMNGTFDAPFMEGNMSVLTGTAPVACMRDYQKEVNSYTRGSGRLFCTVKGYEPCHNAEEVMEAVSYDSEKDLENPTGSVFCSHGAGFVVSWDQVEQYMHVESGIKLEQEQGDEKVKKTLPPSSGSSSVNTITQEEVEEIFTRTYGVSSRGKTDYNRSFTAGKSEPEYQYKPPSPGKMKEKRENYLLVDGYNIIYAWKELKELAEVNLDSARHRLMDILCNYQGYKRDTLILVFDAYKVKGGAGSVEEYHNIHVIYTKEAETADQYIEKAVHRIGEKYDVTVATSDNLVQMIIWGSGARRLSAQGLKEEVDRVIASGREELAGRREKNGHFPFENLMQQVEWKKSENEEK